MSWFQAFLHEVALCPTVWNNAFLCRFPSAWVISKASNHVQILSLGFFCFLKWTICYTVLTFVSARWMALIWSHISIIGIFHNYMHCLVLSWKHSLVQRPKYGAIILEFLSHHGIFACCTMEYLEDLGYFAHLLGFSFSLCCVVIILCITHILIYANVICCVPHVILFTLLNAEAPSLLFGPSQLCPFYCPPLKPWLPKLPTRYFPTPDHFRFFSIILGRLPAVFISKIGG